jgi:hypothetical protein
MRNPIFNRLRAWVMPVFGIPSCVYTYPANMAVPRALAGGWLYSQQIAPQKFRNSGLIGPSYGGDLITVQTILRGVNPLDAAAVSTGRAYGQVE